MAAPGTTGSHSTSPRVIPSFLAQPLDVIRSIRSSYSSNNVYILHSYRFVDKVSEGVKDIKATFSLFCISLLHRPS